MSIKKILEIVEWARRAGWADADAALAELEAIEEACVTLHLHGVVHCLNGEAHKDAKRVDDAADHLMGIGREREESQS